MTEADIHYFVAAKEPDAEHCNGELHLKKLTTQDFAKHFGKHPSEINRTLASLKIKPVRHQFAPGTTRPETASTSQEPVVLRQRAISAVVKEKRARYVALYEQGLTAKQVAEIEGAHPSSVSHAIWLAGVGRPKGTHKR